VSVVTATSTAVVKSAFCPGMPSA